jgi:hypothetical protein
MALGGGRYDDELTAAVRAAKVKEPTVAGGVLILCTPNGKGSGFSCQLPMVELLALPSVLRQVADQIEADLVRGKS